jgi:pimeloyl-ACP methyl ester carboxylesterase
MLTELVTAYGWDELAARIPIHCFENEPSIRSSLKFLRRMPWARAKVESFYLFHLREQKRRASRNHADDLRAAAGLVVDTTKGVVDVVEGMHTAIGAVPVITPLVYQAIRGVTSIVGTSIDTLVASLAPLLGESAPGRQREAVLAAMNGVLGDQLEATKSPLAIPMTLRPPLEQLHRGGTLLVLVHGSCLCDLQWSRHGHDHGCALANDLGFTPVYLHYNTGRHVSDNGKDLAELLERESAEFTNIVVVAHSLGGLVARAAIHVAEEAGQAWRGKLGALVTLGTPHHGAPLERAGNLFETALGFTKYSAPLRALGKIRSAGVTDLRYGNIVPADWRDRDRFAHGPDPRTPTPLPKGVRCYAVAATTAPSLDCSTLPSDGLVPVDSALGKHPDDAFTLRFTDQHVFAGLSHLDLLSRPDVYALIRAWLDPIRS